MQRRERGAFETAAAPRPRRRLGKRDRRRGLASADRARSAPGVLIAARRMPAAAQTAICSIRIRVGMGRAAREAGGHRDPLVGLCHLGLYLKTALQASEPRRRNTTSILPKLPTAVKAPPGQGSRPRCRRSCPSTTPRAIAYGLPSRPSEPGFVPAYAGAGPIIHGRRECPTALVTRFRLALRAKPGLARPERGGTGRSSMAWQTVLGGKCDSPRYNSGAGCARWAHRARMPDRKPVVEKHDAAAKSIERDGAVVCCACLDHDHPCFLAVREREREAAARR